MKTKKALLLTTIGALSFGAVAFAITNATLNGTFLTNAEEKNNYWNHYEEVEPTLLRHGSKEFWANCSSLTFSLEEPVGAVIKEGVPFNTTSYFDELDENDPRYIAPIDIDIKGYLVALLDALNSDPYSYIPESMRPEGAHKYSSSELDYDFNNFVNVNSIHYGGYGEQWHMVIENIKQSEMFYNVTNYGSEIIGAANTIVMAFLDNNEDPVVSWSYNGDERYRAYLDYEEGVLDYSIRFNTGIDIPLFGEIVPQLDMNYVVETNTKTIRIQLSEDNALKFVSTPNSYTFGLEYGISSLSRKAYFSLEKDENESVEGHIYEFIQHDGDDLISSAADFYIDEEYTSVVGNKAGGLVGFDGYINELYKTETGYLLGYKVRETFSKWGISKTYNTLWFNLNNITGINSVKAIDNGSVDPHENNHDIYLNNDTSIFKPDKNGSKILKTSRKYDVEMRNQFFYGLEDNEIVEYDLLIPMMFIQDDGDKSGETNYSTFENDILTTNGIAASVNLANDYLEKIREDYLSLIDAFEEHENSVTADIIVDYIGDPSL